jgi:hypothetical protein
MTGRNLRYVQAVSTGDPMHRRVEVRAGVLAGREVVPVPGRPTVVVPADLVQRQRDRVAERLRQPDQRGVRAKRSREIDHLNGAQAQCGD